MERKNKRHTKKRTQRVTSQEEVDAEEAADTHSTVWRERGAIALVPLHRHTEVTAETDMLGETLFLTRNHKKGSKMTENRESKNKMKDY